MKKIRLFMTAMAVVLFGVSEMQGRAVGDRFTVGATTYHITACDDATNNYTVGIFKTTLTGNVSFPATVRDSTNTLFKVTSFTADAAYTKPLEVTSVTLPEGLTTIGGSPHRTMSNLTTINLPSTLNCIEASSRFFYATVGLTTIKFPNGNSRYRVAADGCLYNTAGDTLFAYPSGKARNSDVTFTVPNSVKVIASAAFHTALRLTKVTLGQNVEEILIQNFQVCGSIAEFAVNTSNMHFSASGGMLLNKAGNILITFPPAKTVTNGILTLPASITELGFQAFMSCQQIVDVKLTNVRKINLNPFNTCNNLQTITIYSSLEEVVNRSAMISYSVSTNAKFTKWILSGTNDYFDVVDGVLYNKDHTVLINFPAAKNKQGSFTTLPETKIIGNSAFSHSNMLTLNVSDNVELLDTSAISWTNQLKNVYFNTTSKLKRINRKCFWQLSQLSTITLPASLETIESEAFGILTVLKSVYFGSGSKLSVVDSAAFSGCTALETFEFQGTHNAAALTIADRAFQGCSKLASGTGGEFVFPQAVDSIGESAFNGCSSLTTATFHETSAKKPALKYIGRNAFQNTGLLAFTIPDGVTFVGNEAFNSCQQLRTISIPAAATYVGPQAFLFCGQLREILVDKQNPNYSSVDGMFASKDKKTLYSYPAGKTGTYYTMLSPSFEVINDSAFYYNRNLQAVTIPKKVTRIGEHAFAICTNLKRINFLADNPVTDVHEEAFVNMQKASMLPNIDLYVRNGHADAYRANAFWNRAKSVNEAFISNSDELGRVEFFPMSETDVSIVSVQPTMNTSEMTTLVVPEKAPGTNYSVKLIGDYAFEGSSTQIDEVVIPSSVTLNYIGARAFVKGNSSPAIRSVFMVNSTPCDLATSTFGLHDAGVTGTYDEIEDGQTIYVKKSAEPAFKTAWDTMADKISYRIPGMKISKTYGTFAREFDVNLADYFETNGTGRVYAFTSNAGGIQPGTGDVEGNPTNYYIRMRSINEGQEGDGTYIPAGTGVLLKTMGGASATASDFYYTIGEKDVNAAASSTMVGVTRSPEKITASASSPRYFVVSGGNFKEVKNQSVWIPAHKAYLKLDNMPAGAKLMFLFNDDVTSIDRSQLAVEGSANGDIFDLQGRKVTAPTKGIYIKNGKKIIIK